jgi:hypothetical protein
MITSFSFFEGGGREDITIKHNSEAKHWFNLETYNQIFRQINGLLLMTI